MLSRLKDSAASAAAKSFLQTKVGGCAQIQDLRLDSAGKTVSLTVLLHGETEAIEVEVAYRKTSSGLQVERCHSNRAWLNVAAADHAVGKEFRVPAAVLMAL